ncbi:methyltransferase [Zunongwangia sp. HGR-M22]|uniref:methyltransferase n=1 Tax=Zunongwangia sp. HGR-M22 TaxID=3015168 RepID=UPI0022DE8C55|nr:methyltransferase [Zunongwangia sp. HGR-M22]WBL26153.1 methyltransferase [Zunongwangia sp. HGR-M22]
MYEDTYPGKRFQKTLEFLSKHVKAPSQVLDLGIQNPFSEIMRKEGYKVTNTTGEDLDEKFDIVKQDFKVVTAFEIFEHLLNPYTILKNIKADKLVATVPLKLWFAEAYRSKTDMRDRHYHEFEDWQFDWLLEKSGWEIKARANWTNPVNKVGIRPILRRFTPRYYAVYAERK